MKKEPKILIVTNSRELQARIGQILHQYRIGVNFDILVAKNAVEAMISFSRFEVLLMIIHNELGSIDGGTLVQMIRESGRRESKTPLILIYGGQLPRVLQKEPIALVARPLHDGTSLKEAVRRVAPELMRIEKLC